MSKEEFAERVIFENSLKLYERFLKNFEFWGGETLNTLTSRLKLKGMKVPLYSWLQLRATCFRVKSTVEPGGGWYYQKKIG